MKSKYEVVKDFIEILKRQYTRGQDEYPFWYIYKDEFKDLDDILDDYNRISIICHTGNVERK